VTVVLSTHYLEEAERLADLVHIVDAGRVIASGAPADLVGPSRGVLLSTAEPLDPAVPAAALGCTVRAVNGTTVELTGDVTPQQVGAWCGAQGIGIVRLQATERSLEDVFLELTGRALR
jgi:ABC-2 type transport system ATP-binding protein